MELEGCPLQFDKTKKPGDCRICPQGESCMFIIIMKKLDSLEERLELLSRKIKT